jgi:hypothetical protein
MVPGWFYFGVYTLGVDVGYQEYLSMQRMEGMVTEFLARESTRADCPALPEDESCAAAAGLVAAWEEERSCAMAWTRRH